MLNFKNTIGTSGGERERKKKLSSGKLLYIHTPLNYTIFSMLINMSIAVLQVPDTLYLLATCTFSKYATVDSVVVSWKL